MFLILPRLCLILTLLLTPLASQASTPSAPPPASKKQTLKNMEESLQKHKEEKAIMDRGLKSLEKEIEDNRQRLIEIGRAIQKNENDLLALDQTIQTNETQRAALAQKLEADKDAIVQLILAMERLKQIPMAALAVRPGAPLETAQSALLIEEIGESLKTRTDTLKQDVSRFETLLIALEDDKETLKNKTEKLERDKAELSSFLDKKQALYKRSSKDVAQKTATIARISKESSSMKDLLSNLEKQRQKEAQQAKAHAKKAKASTLPFAIKGRDSTKFGMPVAGIIRVKYGAPDHLNAPSKGLWLEGRPNGLVVAPLKGRVRFVGEFKSYGKIIIIEHSNDYHSLIAGLGDIDVVLDQNVAGGEPIGHLRYSGENGKAPMIYLELRKSGKAIDPAVKLGKLSSN